MSSKVLQLIPHHYFEVCKKALIGDIQMVLPNLLSQILLKTINWFTKVHEILLRYGLHTAINRADFVSW